MILCRLLVDAMLCDVLKINVNDSGSNDFVPLFFLYLCLLLDFSLLPLIETRSISHLLEPFRNYNEPKMRQEKILNLWKSDFHFPLESKKKNERK